MNKNRRFLGLFLAVCTLLGILSVSAFAETEEKQAPEWKYTLEDIQSIGTTPRPDRTAQVLAKIDPEAAAFSLEAYQNFIKADPEVFLWTEEGIRAENRWDDITDEQMEYVTQLTSEIVEGCTTADEEIYAVMEYLAKNICYDYDYYEGRTSTTNLSAYSVLTEEYTVCSGYAVTFCVMMQLLEHPCVFVLAPNHAWNMVYNGERWMLVDVTWISGSTMRDGMKSKSDYLWTAWYDFTIEQANGNYNHTIEELPYLVCGGELLQFPQYTKITQFAVPDCITSIGEDAFIGCSSLS